MSAPESVAGERADLLQSLARQRHFLRHTTRGLTDEQVAHRTEELVVRLPDLDAAHPLPPAPWFEPGARWSARRVLLHVIAETAQHAGQPAGGQAIRRA